MIFHVMSHHWIPGRTPLNIIDILVAGHMKRWPERCSVLHCCIYYSEALCQHLLPHWSLQRWRIPRRLLLFTWAFCLAIRWALCACCGSSGLGSQTLSSFYVLAAALLQLYSTRLEHIGTYWNMNLRILVLFPDYIYICVCTYVWSDIYPYFRILLHVGGFFGLP